MYGLRRVVLGSRAVGAVLGLEKVATLIGSLRNKASRFWPSVGPPWIVVVAGSKPRDSKVGTAKSPLGPIRVSGTSQQYDEK